MLLKENVLIYATFSQLFNKIFHLKFYLINAVLFIIQPAQWCCSIWSGMKMSDCGWTVSTARDFRDSSVDLSWVDLGEVGAYAWVKSNCKALCGYIIQGAGF